MIDIVRIHSLGGVTLNEESIDNFVSFRLDENIHRKRHALESNRNLYADYGPYWLELANTYYQLGMYNECIQAIREYEVIQIPIFRKDYDYAKMLPFVIISASYVFTNPTEYSSEVEQYLRKLIDNTNESQWSLRYFAAQMYIHLASISNRSRNLTSAYNLLLNNVRFLSHEQERLLNQYISQIDERIPQGISRERRRQQEKMINELKRQRRTELPPLHEGLVTNYQVLFVLMQELQTSAPARNEINAIIDNAFISPTLRNHYIGEHHELRSPRISRVNVLDAVASLPGRVTGTQSWSAFSLELPAVYLTNNSVINVNIRSNNRAVPMHDLPYSVTEVIRGRNALVHEYLARIRIPMTDAIILERNFEYEMWIEIITADVSSSLVFLSPQGRTDFVFDRIE